MKKQVRLKEEPIKRLELRVPLSLYEDMMAVAIERGISLNAEGIRRLGSKKQNNDTVRWRQRREQKKKLELLHNRWNYQPRTSASELRDVDIEPLPGSQSWTPDQPEID